MAIINQIVKGGGTTPTGSISITNNGTYDVTDKATAVVNVPTTAPALYREFELDANGVLKPNTTTTHIMDFTGVTDIDEYALYKAYFLNTHITGVVDMSDLTSLTGNSCCSYAFAYSTITGFDLSLLRDIGGSSSTEYMFMNCPNITSANFPALISIRGYYCMQRTFSGCGRLTSINFPVLQQVIGANALNNCFRGCSGLTSASFPALTLINQNRAFVQCFCDCTSLTSLSFPALTSTSFGMGTTQFNNMLQGVTGCTVHFPSNLQSVIGSWADVVAGFGGTNTTVLFDLPATE